LRTAGATSVPKSDRAHDVGVREGSGGELHEEPVVVEDLVLEEDLLDDLLRAPDEVGSVERAGGVRSRGS